MHARSRSSSGSRAGNSRLYASLGHREENSSVFDVGSARSGIWGVRSRSFRRLAPAPKGRRPRQQDPQPGAHRLRQHAISSATGRPQSRRTRPEPRRVRPPNPARALHTFCIRLVKSNCATPRLPPANVFRGPLDDQLTRRFRARGQARAFLALELRCPS